MGGVSGGRIFRLAVNQVFYINTQELFEGLSGALFTFGLPPLPAAPATPLVIPGHLTHLHTLTSPHLSPTLATLPPSNPSPSL